MTLNAVLHTTCVATLLAGGHQENALPQRAQATVQCRVMPGETMEQTRTTLVGVVADPASTSRWPAGDAGPGIATNPAILGAVEHVAHSMWPGVSVMPTMAAGASDNIYTRAAGIAELRRQRRLGGFRVTIAPWPRRAAAGAHFYESVEFTYRLMKELGNSGQ